MKSVEALQYAMRQHHENIRHRTKVVREAKEALMNHLHIDDGTARDIIIAISQGLIPNVTVNF